MISPLTSPAWKIWGIFGPWQVIAFLGLVGLIVFWVLYRKRQM